MRAVDSYHAEIDTGRGFDAAKFLDGLGRDLIWWMRRRYEIILADYRTLVGCHITDGDSSINAFLSFSFLR
jgi:hypothetical protein